MGTKRSRYLLIFLMTIYPFLLCVVYCLLQRCSLFSIDLTASKWNDEFIYYKQVEGMVKYGIPQGFFGYNESRAAMLSFSTWGPGILLPWFLFGKLFGWNYFSPILSNLLFACVLSGVCTWLLKPRVRSVLAFVLLSATFRPFPRFILSGMPEVYMYGGALMILALSIAYCREKKTSYIYAMYILIPFLTVGRPYMMAFCFLPLGLSLWNKKKRELFVGLLICLASFGLYIFETKYLCATYFSNSVQLGWLDLALSGQVKWASYVFRAQLKNSLLTFGECIKAGVLSRLPRGVFCFTFVIQLLALCVSFLLSIKRKQKNRSLLLGIYGFMEVCMLAAVMMIYPDLQAAAKHLTIFTLGGFVFLAEDMKENKENYFIIPLSVFFIYAFSFTANDFEDYNFDLPRKTMEHSQSMENWKQALEKNVKVKEMSAPSYDNTAMWIFAELSDDDRLQVTPWQQLYALPAGIGIECCSFEYVQEHFEELQCGYIYTMEGESIDVLCKDADVEEICRMDGLVFYKLK